MSGKWILKVQKSYSSLTELKMYDGMYKIAERCGYNEGYFDCESLWLDNPIIGGSVNPDDFGIIESCKYSDEVKRQIKAYWIAYRHANGNEQAGKLKINYNKGWYNLNGDNYRLKELHSMGQILWSRPEFKKEVKTYSDIFK